MARAPASSADDTGIVYVKEAACTGCQTLASELML